MPDLSPPSQSEDYLGGCGGSVCYWTLSTDTVLERTICASDPKWNSHDAGIHKNKAHWFDCVVYAVTEDAGITGWEV